jgi:hypothetical protein
VIETTAMKRLFGERPEEAASELDEIHDRASLGGAGGLEAGISVLTLAIQFCLRRSINSTRSEM